MQALITLRMHCGKDVFLRGFSGPYGWITTKVRIYKTEDRTAGSRSAAVKRSALWANHRSRSSSGTGGVREEEAVALELKLLESMASQPSALPGRRGARRGADDRIPRSTSRSSWFVGDLTPDPDASGSTSSSLSSW